MSLVTIILTTFNSQRFLARSIRSCLEQTRRDLELLVVDGGSTDGTLAIVASAAARDARLHLIHQRDNEGKLPGALNLGMGAARGEYITWTQADSYFEPNAIQAMVEYLEAHPEVGLVYADYWEVDEDGRPIRYQQVGDYTPERLLVDDVVRQCFLFRRQVYEAIGPQDTRYFPVHEVPWRLKVAERFPIQALHTPLLHYTVHTASLTGRIGNRELRRMAAAVLRENGYLDRRAYHRRLADIDITEAYERYKLDAGYGLFYRHALLGIAQDPHWLRNHGLLKLLLASALPGRDAYRGRYLAAHACVDGGAVAGEAERGTA